MYLQYRHNNSHIIKFEKYIISLFDLLDGLKSDPPLTPTKGIPERKVLRFYSSGNNFKADLLTVLLNLVPPL